MQSIIFNLTYDQVIMGGPSHCKDSQNIPLKMGANLAQILDFKHNFH